MAEGPGSNPSTNPSEPRAAAQRGNIDFIDQVAEKGRLGQDLDVEERRRRLKRDGRQLLEPMEPARRVDVVAAGRRRSSAAASQPEQAGPSPRLALRPRSR